jgi:hypothetical protein
MLCLFSGVSITIILTLNVDHAASWNRLEIFGDPITGSCVVTFYNNDKKQAVATLGRDIQNLCAEITFEEEIRNIK